MLLPMILPQSIGKIDLGNWGIYTTKKQIKLWFESEGIIKNKPTRVLIRKQRCLIPANGFFIKHHQNYFFMYFPDQPVITMAGLYSVDNQSENKKHTYQFAILTKPAMNKISSYTSRMPFIISTGTRRKFLNQKSYIIAYLTIMTLNLLPQGLETVMLMYLQYFYFLDK